MRFPTGPSGAGTDHEVDGDGANHATVIQNHNGENATERSTLTFRRGNRAPGRSTLRFDRVYSGYGVRRRGCGCSC